MGSAPPTGKRSRRHNTWMSHRKWLLNEKCWNAINLKKIGLTWLRVWTVILRPWPISAQRSGNSLGSSNLPRGLGDMATGGMLRKMLIRWKRRWVGNVMWMRSMKNSWKFPSDGCVIWVNQNMMIQYILLMLWSGKFYGFSGESVYSLILFENKFLKILNKNPNKNDIWESINNFLKIS